MHLIGSSLSPYVGRVVLQLALKGQSLDVVPRPGESGTPEMAEQNPFGKIPVLVTDAGNLIESVAIMEYLEGYYADSPSLLPSDPFELAQMRALIDGFDQYVLPNQFPLWYKLFGMGTTDEELSSARDAMAENMAKLAEVLTGSGQYLNGDSITLSDVSLAPFFPLIGNLCERLQIENPLVESPPFASWWEKIQGNEHVAKVGQERVAALAEMMGG